MSEKNSILTDLTIAKGGVFSKRLLIKSVIYAFAIFGLLFILLLFALVGLIKQDAAPIVPVPDAAVVTFNFDDVYAETQSDDLLAEVTGVKMPTFYELIRLINVAALDERVKAIAGKINVSPLGAAQTEELRKAILNFRSMGKKAYIFSNGFGSFGGGTAEYYLASAFDEIWMQPNSEVGITGIGFEVPFFRKTLDKIGVLPEFFSRYEYKTAMSSMTDEKMSVAYRKQLTKLGESLLSTMVTGMAETRKLEKDFVKKQIDKAPLLAEDALTAGLIDKIAYQSDFMTYVGEESKATFINYADYGSGIKTYGKGVPTIAFLVIDGLILDGESYVNPLKGDIITGSETVLSQIEDIARQNDVKALVLRINSPGGGYGASNDIWYNLKKLKKDKNIPIVVSMGDYAASGGYFVSLAGDYLIADAMTLTGSIGVLGGKIVLSGLWKKLGVNWEQIKFGNNAGILSANRPFSKNEKSIFNKSLDEVYKDFTLRVSEARKIDLSELNKLARGRVWSGVDAQKVRLVDEVGGLDSALYKAKEMANIAPEDKFRIVYYPKEKSWQEKIRQFVGGGMISAEDILSKGNALTEEMNLLRRLEYDAVLPPMKLNM